MVSSGDMEARKCDIDVEISEIPEEPLFKQTKIKGSAKVRIKTFGVTLNWIPWVVSQKKVKINFPGFTRIIEGKRKCFPTISFTDKKLDKLVCRMIKRKVLLELEELEKKAIEQQEKKKAEAKRKERQKKLSELKVFFSLSKERQEDILWDLWGKSYRNPRKKKKSTKNYRDRSYGDWLGQREKQGRYVEMLKKFEIWKKNRFKQMRENMANLETIFAQEGGQK